MSIYQYHVLALKKFTALVEQSIKAKEASDAKLQEEADEAYKKVKQLKNDMIDFIRGF